MAQLATTYMGIPLANPIIAGASELTAQMDTIYKIEEAGAGALVIKSLFEEQIQLERFRLAEELARENERYAEMVTLFPKIEHAGPKEHLGWVKKTTDSVKIPVFASLNCVNPETWLDYAKQIEQTGVSGIELNFYASPKGKELIGGTVEDEQVNIVQQIIRALSIPVSVKLSPFYTNPEQLVARLDNVGVKGFVLFNRLFQPDIDVEQETLTTPFNLSHPTAHRLPLRYAGLLYGQVQGDVCSSTGIFSGQDVVKMLLAGSQCVQVVSALYKNKIGSIVTMLREIEAWMDRKSYTSVDDFRGKLSKQHTSNPWAYEREQYVKLLFEAEDLIKNAPLP
jgi:dihydroorotate dehydrogenase (fumarate)